MAKVTVLYSTLFSIFVSIEMPPCPPPGQVSSAAPKPAGPHRVNLVHARVWLQAGATPLRHQELLELVASNDGLPASIPVFAQRYYQGRNARQARRVPPTVHF